MAAGHAKIISFMGITRYSTIKYSLKDSLTGTETSCDTRLVPVALRHCLLAANTSVDALLVIGTVESIRFAKSDNSLSSDAGDSAVQKTLWQELTEGVTKPIPICLGESNSFKASDAWPMFGEIAKHINDGDHVILDITLSMRVFQFLGILIIAFLQTIRENVQVDVYYGDIVLKTGVGTLVPVTEYLRLFEWIKAADRLINTGDGMPLSDEINGFARQPGAAGIKESLMAASEKVAALTSASKGVQLKTVMDLAKDLGSLTIEESPDEFEPLKLLLERVAETYVHAGAKNPSPEESLNSHVQMLRFYRDSMQWDKGLLAASETIISAVCLHCDLKKYYPRLDDQRKIAKNLINNPNERPDQEQAIFQKNYHFIDATREIWSKLTPLRHSIAHGQFAGRRLDANGIEEAIKIVGDVEGLANMVQGEYFPMSDRAKRRRTR